MKKNIFLLLLTVIITVCSVDIFAKSGVDFQDYPKVFQDNDIVIQAGLGLSQYGVYGDTVIPPINISFDYGKSISKLPLSFGAYFGYAKSEYKYAFYTSEYKWEYTYYIIGARALWHVNFNVKNLDVYGGVLAGYTYVSVEETSTSTIGGSVEGSYINIGACLGARYFFTDNLGAFAEVGYGVALFNFGLSFKI